MSELRADPEALRRRAAGFEAEAQDHRAVATADTAGVETDIAGFGEIKQMLHQPYRDVHALKQRAWTDHGTATDAHADKIKNSAAGYDRQEAAGAAALANPDSSPTAPAGGGGVAGARQGVAAGATGYKKSGGVDPWDPWEEPDEVIPAAPPGPSGAGPGPGFHERVPESLINPLGQTTYRQDGGTSGPVVPPNFTMQGPGIQEVVPGAGNTSPQLPPGVAHDPPIGAPSDPDAPPPGPARTYPM